MTRWLHGENVATGRTWGSLERRGMRDLTTHTTHVENQQGIYGIRCRRKILTAVALGQENVSEEITQYH